MNNSMKNDESRFFGPLISDFIRPLTKPVFTLLLFSVLVVLIVSQILMNISLSILSFQDLSLRLSRESPIPTESTQTDEFSSFLSVPTCLSLQFTIICLE